MAVRNYIQEAAKKGEGFRRKSILAQLAATGVIDKTFRARFGQVEYEKKVGGIHRRIHGLPEPTKRPLEKTTKAVTARKKRKRRVIIGGKKILTGEPKMVLTRKKTLLGGARKKLLGD